MNDEKLNFSQWNPTTAAPFLKEKEGLRLRAYKDIGGVWTIGYGHTGGVHAGQVIDLKTANRIASYPCSGYTGTVCGAYLSGF